MKVLYAIAASSVVLSSCGLSSRDTFDIPEPDLGSEARPIPFSEISTVGMELSVPLSEIAAAANEKVPSSFSGVEQDPTDWLTEDTVRWNLQRGEIKVEQGQSGELLFSIPINAGNATLHGRVGVRRRNRGPLGRLEEALGGTFRESVQFGGVISGSLSPGLRQDWTVDPHLQLNVDLNRAEARLFGRALRISFRQKIEEKIRPRAAELAAEVNQSLRSEGRLRQAFAQGWQRLHDVSSVSTDPQVWLITSPVSIAASDPAVHRGSLNLRLSAAVRTALSLQNSKPTLPPASDLPPLRDEPRGEPGFTLAVPVSARLADAKFRGSEDGSFEVPLDEASVKVSGVQLSGDNGRLVVSAKIDASHPTMDKPVRGRIYLLGRPELNAQSMTISVRDLDYSLETRNVLARTANWILRPYLLNEIGKRAVFSFADSKQQFLAKANDQIGEAKASLPDGLSTDLNLRELNLAGLVVDDGWLTALLTASGPARFTFDGRRVLTPEDET